MLLIVLGLVLSGYGARFGRRFTAWAWAAGLVLGCLLVVDDIFGGSGYVGAGLTLAVLGALVVAGAAWLSRALQEPPEVDEAAPEPVGAPR